MIVRDEQELLPRCLSSVRSLVDQMVVVDTGSTDRTREIAQSYGANVYPFAWCQDFAAARNESLKHAQGEWILVLDADEVLLPEMIPTLRQAMQPSQHLVINLLRQEIGAAQAPYSLISRLFRNHPAIAFHRPYHELIDDSVSAILQQEPHWQIVTLPDVAMRHTGYQSAAIAQRQKRDRARDLMAAYLTQQPNDTYICNKLGALYLDSGDVAKGLELLQIGLQSTEPPVLYEVHYHLGSAYGQLQQVAEAERHYQAAVEQPIAPMLKLGAYNNWGNLRLEQGDPMWAKGLYERVVAIDPTFAAGHYNLGMALRSMGQLAEAIAHYQQAIQLNPAYAEAYQNLGVALLKLGQVPASLDAFRQAIDLHQAQNSPEAERLRQGLQAMGFWCD
jgi:tetratricopeptide (TPR) repeat protein